MTKTTTSFPIGSVASTNNRPALAYLARLAGDGQRTQARALERAAELLGGVLEDVEWSAWTYAHSAAVRARLVEVVDAGELAVSTANKTLSAVRGVLREAWRLGVIEHEVYLRAVDIDALSGSSLPAGRHIEASELTALVGEPQTPAEHRDAAALALLYGCGLRRSEAVSVNVEDVDLVAGTLRVMGKGQRERSVPLAPGVIYLLRSWLNVRGREPGGALLCPVNKGGKVTVRRMSGHAIYKRIKKRAGDVADRMQWRYPDAADALRKTTPHDCRRSFVGDLIDASDVSTAQALAGHASPATTVRYDRRGERVKRRAVTGLKI